MKIWPHSTISIESSESSGGGFHTITIADLPPAAQEYLSKELAAIPDPPIVKKGGGSHSYILTVDDTIITVPPFHSIEGVSFRNIAIIISTNGRGIINTPQGYRDLNKL